MSFFWWLSSRIPGNAPGRQWKEEFKIRLVLLRKILICAPPGRQFGRAGKSLNVWRLAGIIRPTDYSQYIDSTPHFFFDKSDTGEWWHLTLLPYPYCLCIFSCACHELLPIKHISIHISNAKLLLTAEKSRHCLAAVSRFCRPIAHKIFQLLSHHYYPKTLSF